MGTNRLVTIEILLLLSGLGHVRGGSFVVSVSTALTRRRTTPSSTRTAGTTTTTSSARCCAGSTAGRGRLCSPSYCNVRREGQVRASASDINNQDDNSGLFPTSSSYVPSGLTVEEYQQIKANEAERLQSLDLGAWGPKFLQSKNGANGSGGQPPEGDWMVMPRLWTHGYDSNVNMDRSSSSTSTSKTSKLRQVPRRLVQSMRQYGPAFVLAYVLVGTIHSMIRLAVHRIFVGSMVVSSTVTGRKVVVAVAVLRAVVAALSAPHIRSTYLEDKSRVLLWSQRRLWCVTVVALSVVRTVAARGMMGR